MASMAVVCAAILAVFTAGAMDRSQAAAASSPGIAEQPVPAPVVNMPAARHKHKRPKVLLALWQTSPAQPAAPQSGGSISGTVEDPSGARVPGCTVVLLNQDGAELQSVHSDAAGLYQFSSLPPGHYSAEYRMRGFAILKKAAEIAVGNPARIDAQLAIAQTNTTLEVIGQKPAAQPAPEPGAISVGGRVEAAKLLVHTDPIYPPELRAQGIEGTVSLAAIISSDGIPVELRVLNTDQVDPRLAQAALDAVRQWRYQPTKLNEHPVTSSTNIYLNFEMGK
jgi:TonB family protein